MRPFRSLLGSERCILASAGGLSAGDPPSLNGDAAGATLSVNALVEMIADCARMLPAKIQRSFDSSREPGRKAHKMVPTSARHVDRRLQHPGFMLKYA